MRLGEKEGCESKVSGWTHRVSRALNFGPCRRDSLPTPPLCTCFHATHLSLHLYIINMADDGVRDPHWLTLLSPHFPPLFLPQLALLPLFCHPNPSPPFVASHRHSGLSREPPRRRLPPLLRLRAVLSALVSLLTAVLPPPRSSLLLLPPTLPIAPRVRMQGSIAPLKISQTVSNSEIAGRQIAKFDSE